MLHKSDLEFELPHMMEDGETIMLRRERYYEPGVMVYLPIASTQVKQAIMEALTRASAKLDDLASAVDRVDPIHEGNFCELGEHWTDEPVTGCKYHHHHNGNMVYTVACMDCYSLLCKVVAGDASTLDKKDEVIV